MTTYQIQSRTAATDDRDAAAWSSHVGDQNEFATEDEAEDGIDSLIALGDEWADAEYRVVPCRATAQELIAEELTACYRDAIVQGYDGTRAEYEYTAADLDSVCAALGRKPTAEEWAATGLPGVGGKHVAG